MPRDIEKRREYQNKYYATPKWREYFRIYNLKRSHTKKGREERIRWRIRNKLYRAYYMSCWRAKKLNVKCFLTFDEYKSLRENAKYCSMCKCLLDKNTDKMSFDSLTFDHVIPIRNGGEHSKENIKIVCNSCNSWKYGNKEKYAKKCCC